MVFGDRYRTDSTIGDSSQKDPLGSLLERPRGSDALSQEDLVGLSQYIVSMAGSYPASALSFWAMKPSMTP